jgi:hypothetical protein
MRSNGSGSGRCQIHWEGRNSLVSCSSRFGGDWSDTKDDTLLVRGLHFGIEAAELGVLVRFEESFS